MTREEFLAQFGEQRVRFDSYYKYTFSFTDGELFVEFGGNPDDIYRFEVDTEAHTIRDLFHEAPLLAAYSKALALSEYWG